MKYSKNILVITALLGLTMANITIDPETRTYRDEFNRARIFHGQNVVMKLPPYIPLTDKFDP